MSEDAPPSVKLHKSPSGGKNSRRFLQDRFLSTQRHMQRMCDQAKVYTGPISKWLYARVWLSIRLYGIAERIQDIGRTPVAYIAQGASIATAIWWAWCLIRRPELLGTSIYLRSLQALGTPRIIAVMIGLGFYQLGSILFGPSQGEIQRYLAEGHHPYPGTRFWLTVIGLAAACGTWASVAFLTYHSGGLNMGMGSYLVLSGLQTIAAIQIARVLTIARRDAVDRIEAAKRAAQIAQTLPAALGVVSPSTSTQLPLSR